MKNKNKGFTLIELLVVVAIIGILAAVGTVAYTGYTASAKKNAAKTLHSQAAKYIAAEIQKCTLDSNAKAMGGAIDCSSAATGTAVPNAVNYAQAYVDSGVKNPYKPADAGAANPDALPAEAAQVEGLLYLITSGDNITLSMLSYDGDGTTADPDQRETITITVE